MEENRNLCQMLMEEYELLRSRLEPLMGSGSLSPKQIQELGITMSDLKRIQEIEAELDKNCSEHFPKFNRIDLGAGVDNGLFSDSSQ